MLDKLHKLEENVAFLSSFAGARLAEKRDEYALRYALQESIQIVIDVACNVAATHNMGVPATYRDCVALLAKSGHIDADLEANLGRMIGLRNLLVHEYDDIDPTRLLRALENLDDFGRFGVAMAPLLKGTPKQNPKEHK